MKQVDPSEARQGREGKPVLVILVVSLLAALAVWGLVEIYGNAIAAEPPAQNSSTESGRLLETKSILNS